MQHARSHSSVFIPSIQVCECPFTLHQEEEQKRDHFGEVAIDVHRMFHHDSTALTTRASGLGWISAALPRIQGVHRNLHTNPVDPSKAGGSPTCATQEGGGDSSRTVPYPLNNKRSSPGQIDGQHVTLVKTSSLQPENPETRVYLRLLISRPSPGTTRAQPLETLGGPFRGRGSSTGPTGGASTTLIPPW